MPALQTPHPVPEQLAAFGLGRLSDDDSKQIELHLADCEVCRKQIEELPADSLVSLLQATASDTLDGSLPSDSTADAKADVVVPAPDGSLPPLYKKMAQIISGKPQEQKRPAPKSESVAATVVKPNFTVPRELEAHARYDVLAPLGAGGMGTVYKAQHRLMERVVALKIVNPLLVNKPGAAERFTREVKAAAQLVHPNIVTAYDAENVNGLLLLVMEHVEGQSLADVIGGKRELPIAKACEYVRQTALGLQHALERGMVHRDIKPQNLMLTSKSEIKILDFGLARFVSEQAKSDGSTEHGSLMGSPDYMAPEQAQDAHSADARADIYSMGCTLYQLLAGQVPFPESSLLKKLEAHRDKLALALNLLRADVSPELAKVVEKMMAKDPAQRYQTPAEVAEALAPFTTMKTVPMPAEPQTAPLHRRPKFVAALAVCLLLVGGGIFLAPYVLRVQTEKGTLVITSDDPDVQIEVKQGGKTVVLFFPKEKRQIELKAGEYTIELVGGKQGLKLSTNKFKIEHGENKTVTVEFVPNPAPVAQLRQIKDVVSLDPRALLVNDRFDDPKTSAFGWGAFERQFKNNRLVLNDDQSGVWGSSVQQFNTDIVCEVTATVLASPHKGWGVAIVQMVENPKGDGRRGLNGIEALINSDGELRIVPGREVVDEAARIAAVGPIRLANYKGNGKPNTLSIIVRGGKRLEIFVNGVEACEPVTLKQAIAPVHTQLATLGGDKGSALAYESFKVWSLRPAELDFPFSPEDGQKKQVQWAEHLQRKVVESNSLGMKLALIPPGEFPMTPEYRVRLSKPFYLSVHNVTVGQFRQFVNETGYKTTAETNGGGYLFGNKKFIVQKPEYTWNNRDFSATDDHPVVFVSWTDATKYCAWLSLKEKKHYRLPTAAEWEWASRGGALRDAKTMQTRGWFEGKSGGKSQPVGKLPADVFGLFDMFGNVQDVCNDWWGPHPKGFQVDPKGPPNGQSRVTRGGSYLHTPEEFSEAHSDLRVAGPDVGTNKFSIRVVCDLAAPDEIQPDPSPTIPSVAELLKSREVLTVAQDGKAMYATLAAALEKIKTGQVIHVLDKGPYRESLIREVPENIALVSQVGTRIEVPKWHRWGPEPSNKDKTIYQGLTLGSLRGIRLSGFDIICPELPSDASGSVAVEFPQGGEIVVESCRIVHTPSYERDKTPQEGSGELFNSLRLGRNDADAGSRQIVRDCHLEGTVDFARGNATEVVMERNRVLAHRLSMGVGFGAMRAGKTVIRHNVIHAYNAIYVGPQDPKEETKASYLIANNVLDVTNSALWASDFDKAVVPKAVRIHNNIVHSRNKNGFAVTTAAFPKVKDVWQVSHNCYRFNPNDSAKQPDFVLLETGATDQIRATQFLSDDRAAVTNYLRIAADSPLGTAGIGGDLPKYIGAFLPGPAPKDGDWFTKLLAGSTDSTVPTLPSVEQLLKTREVLTVAQDGSGNFKTIQEALDKVKAGQVILIKGKGPYRESPRKELPADVAIVSLDGVRIEVGNWEAWPDAKIPAWWHKGAWFQTSGSFRMSGLNWFALPAPKDASGLLVDIVAGGDTIVDHCIFDNPHSGYSLNFRGNLDEARKTLFQENYITGIDIHHDAGNLVVQRNWFGKSVGAVVIDQHRGGAIVFRENFVQNNRIVLDLQQLDKANPQPGADIRITNNVIETETNDPGLSIVPYGTPPLLPRSIQVANNIIRSRDGNGIGIEASLFDRVKNQWRIGPNAYQVEPKDRPPDATWPLKKGDIVQVKQFISDNFFDANYLHIAADGDLASKGAGGNLPSYFGALPPGPAPKDGDWFTRLQKVANIKSTFAWPADALRERRISSPDLSKQKVLYHDDFNDPKTGWASGRVEQDGFVCIRGYDNGKYFVEHPADSESGWHYPNQQTLSNFAVQTKGRVVGSPAAWWDWGIDNAERKGNLRIRLNGQGQLMVTFNDWGKGVRPPPLLDITHPAIKKGEEFNTLTVVIRSNQLELYVNGVAVCDPLVLNIGFDSGKMGLGLLGNKARSEFEYVTVWSAEGLPTPEERLGKDEVPVKEPIKLSFAWPVDALQEGRITAPDISKAKLGLQDGWATAKDFGPELTADKSASAGLEKGRFYMQTDRLNNVRWNWSGEHKSFVAQAEGRVVDTLSNHWGLLFDNKQKAIALFVLINGEGSVRVVLHDHVKGDRSPPILEKKHSAIKSGTEFNKLMVILRDQLLEVYVNNTAVCDPIKLDFPDEPTNIQQLMVSNQKGRAEYRHFSVWSAEGLPTPEERLQKGEVPLKVAPIDKLPKQGGGVRPDFNAFRQLIAEAGFGKYISDLAQIAGNPDVQAELKMTPEQIRKALHAHYEMSYQFSPVSSAITTTAEIAAKQCGERSAAIEKGLTEILKADQRRRLREIMLQIAYEATPSPRIRFGPASYPGVAEAIKLTPDQKAKLLAGTKPSDSLTAEQQTAIKEMFGEPYKGQWAPTLPLGPAAGAGGSPGNDNGHDVPVLLRNIAEASFGKYVSDLAHLALNADLQADLKLTPDQVQRAQKAHSSMKPVSSGGPGWSLAVGKKQAEAQSQEIEKAVADIVTEDQKKRFRQIMVQIYDAPTSAANARMRHGVVAYPGVAEAIKLTPEQKTRILAGTWSGDVLNDEQKSAIKGMFGNPYQGRLTPLLVAAPKVQVEVAPEAP